MDQLKKEIIKHNSKLKTNIQLIGDGNDIFEENQKLKPSKLCWQIGVNKSSAYYCLLIFLYILPCSVSIFKK